MRGGFWMNGRGSRVQMGMVFGVPQVNNEKSKKFESQKIYFLNISLKSILYIRGYGTKAYERLVEW